MVAATAATMHCECPRLVILMNSELRGEVFQEGFEETAGKQSSKLITNCRRNIVAFARIKLASSCQGSQDRQDFLFPIPNMSHIRSLISGYIGSWCRIGPLTGWSCRVQRGNGAQDELCIVLLPRLLQPSGGFTNPVNGPVRTFHGARVDMHGLGGTPQQQTENVQTSFALGSL